MSSPEDFERERLRYCESMYSLEKERRQVIERQAQFYFGIITLFMGLLALKKEVWESVRLAISDQASELSVVVIYSELALFLGALISSLLAVLMVFRPERRNKPYPKDLVTDLFSGDQPGTDFGGTQAGSLEAKFLRQSALRFALAVERNSAYNTKMSGWLIVAAVSSVVLVLTYALLATSVLLIILAKVT